VSNGPTENLNLKIKNTKRVARGYRNFNHYRLRLLLNHGRIHEDHSPTRIRTRAQVRCVEPPKGTVGAIGADE
jgi:transposase